MICSNTPKLLPGCTSKHNHFNVYILFATLNSLNLLYSCRIIQAKGSADKRKRIAARQLERQCLLKQLNRVFHNLNTYTTATTDSTATSSESVADGVSSTIDAAQGNRRASTPSRGLNTLNITTSNTASPTMTPTTNNSIFFSANTPRSQFLNKRINTNNAVSTSAPDINPISIRMQPPGELAGWVKITDQLDGFDRNACATLTTQAEWLEIEVHAARAGFESAQAHILSLRRNYLAEDIVTLLESTKVSEFKTRYEEVVRNKDAHIACWEEYTNTQEHILRRQINTEQAFFSAKKTNNKLTQYIAIQLLKMRTIDETAGEGPREPLSLNLTNSEGECS